MLEVLSHPITTAILLSIFSGDVTTSNVSQCVPDEVRGDELSRQGQDLS